LLTYCVVYICLFYWFRFFIRTCLYLRIRIFYPTIDFYVVRIVQTSISQCLSSNLTFYICNVHKSVQLNYTIHLNYYKIVTNHVSNECNINTLNIRVSGKIKTILMHNQWRHYTRENVIVRFLIKKYNETPINYKLR